MIRGFQWDLARQVERLDWLLARLPQYSDWGYEELHLHLEDAVDYPSLPGVARSDAYSWRQFERLVTAADRHRLRVVPIVNLLGHTQYLIKTATWRDLNELRAADGSPLTQGQICPSHPGTLEVAARLLRDVAPFCTAGKVHVGLDESFVLGRHPRARTEVAELGLARYFARYTAQLQALAADHGLRTAIWADMLALLPEAIAHLPAGLVAYDWYYHGFARAPRFEARNFRPYDLASALRARGIATWGCPMNGAFRFEPLPVFGDRLANAQAWWRRCHRTGAEGYLVTGWEPNRLALATTVVVDAAIASLWLDDPDLDQVGMLQRGFERVHGPRHARERARLLLACDERAFCGYARWETHQRWDSVHGRGGAGPYGAELRFFQRASAQPLPAVFAASLRWRAYLAARDELIRTQAILVQRARRHRHRGREAGFRQVVQTAGAALDAFRSQIAAAKAAATAMWRDSRRRNQTNPNGLILRADEERWRRLRSWWRSVERNPARIAESSPVMGRWQLRLQVHTTHPNLQAIAIETLADDGRWHLELLRYLIEFRSHAARPRATIRHALSVSLDGPERPVRIALRGLGQFALSDVHLTDGVSEIRCRPEPKRGGRRIRLRGGPRAQDILQLDREANQDEWRPRWVTPRPTVPANG